MIWAIVRFKKQGTHKWSKAPVAVKQLRELHKHTFRIEVWIQQFHNDRDVEYILFKKESEKIFKRIYDRLGIERSCEMLAEAMRLRLRAKYQDRRIKVGVFEDETQGALIE